MSMNIGFTDRVIRFTLGLLLLSLVLLLDDHTRWIGLIGLIPLVTSMMGICPLYTALGISTCKPDEHPAL
jgi:hypothetical protein